MKFLTLFINTLSSSSSKKSISSSSNKREPSVSSTRTPSNNKISVSSTATAAATATLNSDTTGQSSNFQYKDGRRYHGDAEVAYVLPNDDEEADRVHQQHWILRYAFQCNYHAPVQKQLEQGINVLDSGCGPATWSFEMGEAYPRSRIHGIDASSVFPSSIKPANVDFVIGNIAKHIPYNDDYFDFIFQRLLFLGLTEQDWHNTLNNLYRVLKPGGYIELVEPDCQDMLNAGPAMHKLQTTLGEMSKARGFPPFIANELESRLLKAGFVNAVVQTVDIPMNHSGKMGDLMWADYKHGYMNIRHVMAKSNTEWEDEADYKAHIEQCGQEVAAAKTCFKWYSVYARKPFSDTMSVVVGQ